MIISRFLDLHEKGFNVPTFVQNPLQKYRGDLLVSLPSYIFPPTTKLTLLMEKGGKEKMFSSLSIQEAVSILTAFSKDGYEVLLMERPEWEFYGSVIWNEETGRGVLNLGNTSTLFAFIEVIPNMKMRYVVRTCLDVSKSLDKGVVEVCYGWATGFVGVKCLKLIIYDYKILKN